MIDAIEAGVPGEELKTEIEDLQTRKAALLAQMATMEEPAPLLHPSMRDVYRSKVGQLAAALEHADVEQREGARSALRGFIEKIVIPADETKPLRVSSFSVSTWVQERDGRQPHQTAMRLR